MHYTGAVVGPKGSGKTTFLLELKKHLSEKGFRTSYALLRADHNKPYNEAIRQLGVSNLPHSIIILDGAEQLGFVAWQHFLIRTRLRRGLIISSHSTSRLPTLLECSTSLPLLQELVKQLCPDGYSELQASLLELFKRHNGNIRMCLRDLYDYGINRKPP